MGDCTDEVDETLGSALDQSAIGRRLHAGASIDAAIPADADRLELLIEYVLPMLTGVDQAVRTVAFELDELAAEHHRLAAAVERLSGELGSLREQQG